MTEKSMIPNIKACVFDAYGTLFDVHSAVAKYHERLGCRRGNSLRSESRMDKSVCPAAGAFTVST
jgi:hypothetical protein